MGGRDDDYQKTKAEFRLAIERLKLGKPRNIGLRQKLIDGEIVKINDANVEKEAGKGNASLKRHGNVKKEIKRAESERKYGIPSSITSIEDDPRFKDQKAKLDKVLEDSKKLRSEKKDRNEELARKDELIKLQATKMDEMMASLWAAISPHEIELRMATAKKLATVTHIHVVKDD